MKNTTKNLNQVTNTTVTVNVTLVEKAKKYTGSNDTATLSLVILACLQESNARNLKYSSTDYLLLLPYAQRHNRKNYNIHGQGCVNALKKLAEKLTKFDTSIDNASKAVEHALVQFITAYEKNHSLCRPIKLMGSKWDVKMQKAIANVLADVSYSSVVETCAGALGIFCNINTPKDVLLNDLDKEKIALYKCMQKNCTKLLIDFLLTPKSRKTYECFKKELQNNNRSDYQTASAFLYVNFYDHHYNRRNYNENSNLPSLKNICNYLQISKKLTDVKFSTLNLLDLIPKSRKNTQTLLICDPPYEDTKSYESNLTPKEHQDLAKMLERHKGKFIYFCRISAKGKNPSLSSRIITAKIEDNYANKGFYYFDVPLSDDVIERIITNFSFCDAVAFDIPMNTERNGGDSNE